MKRSGVVLVVILAAFVVANVWAGEKHPCNASAEECLAKMHAKIAAKGWLGVETSKTDTGWFGVKHVIPGSPAESAGFAVGDLVVAVNGVAYTKDNKEALKKVKKGLVPGSTAAYTVKRAGGKVELTAVLGKVPRDVMAQWIGEYMLEHHLPVKVAQK